MNNPVEIDGSFGEGGGQILRTSLTMSLITGKPFHITKIRAGREKPGLSHQHLEAIQAAARISNSPVDGASLRSMELSFHPGKTEPGDYLFEVATAGAMPLVFQTVVLPLTFTGKPCKLEFKGGTHVPWSPPYEYLKEVWGSVVHDLGFDVAFELHQAGYYPQGGGHFTATVKPLNSFSPLNLQERPKLQKLRLIAVLSSLPDTVAQREFRVVEQCLAKLGLAEYLTTEIRSYQSRGPGNLLSLTAQMQGFAAGFSSMGARGKSAEAVAQELCDDFTSFWGQKYPVDQHLADQLLLPLTFAHGTSAYCVEKVTQHLLTNAAIIKLFEPVSIEIIGKEGEPGVVKVTDTRF